MSTTDPVFTGRRITANQTETGPKLSTVDKLSTPVDRLSTTVGANVDKGRPSTDLSGGCDRLSTGETGLER